MSNTHAHGTDPAPSALFSSRVQDGVHVITFTRSDVLDAQYIEQLGDNIYHYLKPIEQPRVVIDMGGVRLLSSAALGMLMALKKVSAKKDGALCIANVNPEVMKVFKLTRLHKLIRIHDGTDAAVASLG